MNKTTVNQSAVPLPSADINWWQSAVIYQVYPRSFQDSNGDGVGDIPGILQRLDYIAALNIDAIWISPFFKSPMKDFGYDISDYRDVDPIFGTLADFDALVSAAHQRGIRIIIDQVLSHTSDQHAWFQRSCESTDNAKSDWYVWADANSDGTPPNNWLSIFGGDAWEWNARRKQYYFHNFLSSQPDLNVHNPEVQQQLLDEMEFWLQRGVDGVRLDAIVHCFHDQALRDNPVRPKEMAFNKGCQPDNPYAAQLQVNTIDRPETIGFIERIRALLDRYPGSVSLGEVSTDDSSATIGRYTQGNNRLHTAYCFELLGGDYSVEFFRNTIRELNQSTAKGWPCWAIGNHDSQRVISRWSPTDKPDPQQVTMLTALTGSLRGPLCIYQGDELGLPEAQVSFEDLQDPYGKQFWPDYKGRDGCRTPMPWTNKAATAGFSSVKSWLPIDQSHLSLSVEQQLTHAQSPLLKIRHFLQWRRQQPALIQGEIDMLDSHEAILIFTRKSVEQTLLIAFNLSNSQQQCTVSSLRDSTSKYRVLNDHGLQHGSLAGAQLSLPPYGVLYANQT